MKHKLRFENSPFSERTYGKYAPSLLQWWRSSKKLAKWADMCEGGVG